MRVVIFGLCTLFCYAAVADTVSDQGGLVEAEVRGKLLRFAALESHYDIDVHGDIANVSVRQKFINPTDTPAATTAATPIRLHACNKFRFILTSSFFVFPLRKMQLLSREKDEISREAGRKENFPIRFCWSFRDSGYHALKMDAQEKSF